MRANQGSTELYNGTDNVYKHQLRVWACRGLQNKRIPPCCLVAEDGGALLCGISTHVPRELSKTKQETSNYSSTVWPRLFFNADWWRLRGAIKCVFLDVKICWITFYCYYMCSLGMGIFPFPNAQGRLGTSPSVGYPETYAVQEQSFRKSIFCVCCQNLKLCN